jgi:phosphoribosylaminoimidazole carboxylase PurE protein
VSPLVGVVMGSKSDEAVMGETAAMLNRFDVPFEVVVLSAHRQPEKTRQYARSARERGLKVIIAGCGLAAHLAGVLASETTLPVVGVPLVSSSLGGMDSLLSMSQMPSGIPVATLTLGTPGARNAALLAIEILALTDERLQLSLEHFRSKMVV